MTGSHQESPSRSRDSQVKDSPPEELGEEWPPPIPDVPLIEPVYAEKGSEDFFRRDIDRQPGEGFFEWVGRRWRGWREARSD